MIDAAASGSTVRLGHLLAPAGVRYIVFVRRAAPEQRTRSAATRPRSATRSRRQLDLTLSRVDDSGVVYDNDAWIPMRAVVPPGNTAVQVDGRDPQAAAVRSEADGVVGVPATSGNDDRDRSRHAVVVGGGESEMGRDGERTRPGSSRRVRVDQRVRARHARARARSLRGCRRAGGRALRRDRGLDRGRGAVVRDPPEPGRGEGRPGAAPSSRRRPHEIAAIRLRRPSRSRWSSARSRPDARRARRRSRSRTRRSRRARRCSPRRAPRGSARACRPRCRTVRRASRSPTSATRPPTSSSPIWPTTGARPTSR